MIKKSDIIDYINSNYSDALDNLHLYEKYILEEIIDLFNIVGENKNEHQINAEKYFIKEIISEYINNKNIFNIRKDKLYRLMKLELPEQRSPEWFEMRSNILTASSFAAALGDCHFTSRNQLIYDKINPRPYESNPITEWGVKYEEIATLFYQLITNTNVKEFGLIPHPVFPIFGASPDGICDVDSPQYYVGRMLEIKCPPIRKFTKEVPEHYWIQMQGQLETCDLEECDFLQVKLEEYSSEEEYQNDKLFENENEKIGYSSTKYPKGLVLTFLSNDEKGNKVYEYEYADFYQTFEQLKEWSSKILENETYQNKECIFNWWKIQRYECTLVGRDRQWWLETMPKIIDFWDDVEHYRKIGNQGLIQKKEDRKQKRMKNSKKKNTKKKSPKYNVIQIDKALVNSIQTTYLLDTDSD